MATIINNPPASPSNDSSNALGLVILLVALVVLGYLGYVYGLPALKQIQLGGAPQINVPSKIDVNINQTK